MTAVLNDKFNAIPASITASTEQVESTKSTLRTKRDKLDLRLEKFDKDLNELEEKFNIKS